MALPHHHLATEQASAAPVYEVPSLSYGDICEALYGTAAPTPEKLLQPIPNVEELGRGAFGAVYAVTLPAFGDDPVAVKPLLYNYRDNNGNINAVKVRRTARGEERIDFLQKEWDNALRIAGKIGATHKNLVRLLGTVRSTPCRKLRAAP